MKKTFTTPILMLTIASAALAQFPKNLDFAFVGVLHQQSKPPLV